MHGAGRNEEVIVLAAPASGCTYRSAGNGARPSRGAARRSRRIAAGSTPAFTPRYTRRIRPGVEQVVALVLRVVHPEVLLDVLGQRMDLERQVAAAHGVEKIEADRELVAEPRVHRLAEQRARLVRRRGRATGSRRALRRNRAAGCSPRARSRSTSRSSARGSRSQPPSSIVRPTARDRRTARRGTGA